MCIALVSILISAVIAQVFARRQIDRFSERAGPPEGVNMGEARGKAIRSMRWGFVIAGIVAILLAFLLSYLLAARISRPLSALTSATRSISGGDYEKRVDVSGGREVAELGGAYNTMAENLERNEKLRRDMVADIAHELRNPLATIRAQLEAVQDEVIEPNMSTMDSLMEDTLLLTRLVGDLQQLSLAEGGQLVLDMTPVDVGETIKGVAARFEGELSRKQISLGLDIAPKLPTVKADELRIAQVLGNLIKNALLNTPSGGMIRLKALQSEAEVTFSVTDTGSGISQEDLPYVFERFYRTDKSRVRATGGAGLGLTIAKSLVQAHGGRIWAESEVGKGTTIYFAIPISKEQGE